MAGCVDCGRQTPNRRCRDCDRDRRYGSDERYPGIGTPAPDEDDEGEDNGGESE